MTEAKRPAIVMDGHCHVASTKFIPRQFLSDVCSNVYVRLQAFGQRTTHARLLEILMSQHQDHEADELVQEMDAAGIARTVLLAPDFSLAMECELDVWELSLAHHRIRQRHPGRFFVFIGVDPRRSREGLDLFETSIQRFGFEGLKLYPPCGYSPSDPALFPYYEICAVRKLPVLLHTGPSAASLNFALAHPSLIDTAARQFPSVNFILAHGRGHSHEPMCHAVRVPQERLY